MWYSVGGEGWVSSGDSDADDVPTKVMQRGDSAKSGNGDVVLNGVCGSLSVDGEEWWHE